MSGLNVQKVRADFPELTQKVRGKNLVYLDSAASALKPWPVIERIGQFYTYEACNIHRGAHFLADRATAEYEGARVKVQKFINAARSEEIIFTAGTTDALNHLAFSLGEELKEGDLVLLTQMEHHANIVPWHLLQKRKKIKIEYVPVLDSGDLDLEALDSLLSKAPKILSITHCSNTIGTVNDIQKISKRAKGVGATVVVDGAQAVANFSVDVQSLGADFYVFSAHKLFGPYGLGVLYGRYEKLDRLTPFRGGGSMIESVTFEKTTLNTLPFRLEAGTPHIGGVIALGAAIDYVESLGRPAIESYERNLLQEATEKLLSVPGLQILGSPKLKAPLISFNMQACHPSDVGQILDQEGVAVRVGHHCTQPLLSRFGLTGTIRASFSVFNNSSDVDILIKGLVKAQEMLL